MEKQISIFDFTKKGTERKLRGRLDELHGSRALYEITNWQLEQNPYGKGYVMHASYKPVGPYVAARRIACGRYYR